MWQIEDQRFATRAEHVVEVLPLVSTRPLPRMPEWVSGLINYRGTLIPAIDAGVLLGRSAIDPRMGTRILVISVNGTEPAGGRLGLIVARVLGLGPVDFAGDHSHPGLTVEDAAYLGPVARGAWGEVQLIELDRLLTPQNHELLFGRIEDDA